MERRARIHAGYKELADGYDALLSMPFADASFDIVLSMNVSHTPCLELTMVFSAS